MCMADDFCMLQILGSFPGLRCCSGIAHQEPQWLKDTKKTEPACLHELKAITSRQSKNIASNSGRQIVEGHKGTKEQRNTKCSVR